LQCKEGKIPDKDKGLRGGRRRRPLSTVWSKKNLRGWKRKEDRKKKSEVGGGKKKNGDFDFVAPYFGDGYWEKNVKKKKPLG